MQWYLNVVKNYAKFQGRARRKEYWMFTLFNTIFMILCYIIDFLVLKKSVSIVGTIYALFMFLPSLAVTIRRLHDTSKSGWWFFISAIPFIGSIVLLIFLCQDSHLDNKYGSNPKASIDTSASYA